MNWLIYLGGGMIFYNIISKLANFNVQFEIKRTKITIDFSWLFSLPAWIWICWKFIK